MRLKHASSIAISSILLKQIHAERIASPAHTYEVCQQVSVGGAGTVYLVDLAHGGGACEHGGSLIIKCGPSDSKDLYRDEFMKMSRMSSETWVPRAHGHFIQQGGPGGPCIVMERLGMDLQKLRESMGDSKLTTGALGTLGARMVEIVCSLHNKYGLVHSDLHAANWMLELSTGKPSTNIKMIDYGDMKPLASDRSNTAQGYAIEEIRQVVITLRYLFDRDLKYYVWKRYNYSESEICAGVPSELCEALRYVNGLQEGENQPPVDYDRLKSLLEAMAANGGIHYSGKVEWGDLITSSPIEDTMSAPARSIKNFNTNGSVVESPLICIMYLLLLAFH